MKANEIDKKYPLTFDLIEEQTDNGLGNERVVRVKARETATMIIALINNSYEERFKKLAKQDQSGRVAIKVSSGAFFQTNNESLYVIDTEFAKEMVERLNTVKRAERVANCIKNLAKNNPRHKVFAEIEELINKYTVNNH